MATDRVQAVFAAAIRCADSVARRELLDRECGADDALRRRVEILLQAHDDSGALPGGLAGGVAEIGVLDSDVREGAVVAGRFKLLEAIGEGGMGTVWLAEQTEPVKRKVALKLVKPGMDSKSVLARFEAERQALALMDHPNIAKVLDGGVTDRRRPYFVMELVKGVPLTEYCDARRLNIRERLELFVPICAAVQHAHQKGIIHRDLKPSNILVAEHDGRPVPKVIDFGLAKALGAAALTERTLHTAFGTVVGTPLYMAPEQVGVNALDVDTRSDVYSLGVILYELLTGTTPLEKRRLREAAWDEVRRVIREEEPPKPSMRLSDSHDSLPSISAQRDVEPAALTKLVKGELDWIAMKALEKDRERRYETANGLSVDVQRYLADEPVQACPPSRAYRFKKFVRRNKGTVLVASAMGLATLIAVGGVAGSIGWTARARAERMAKAAAQVASIADEVQRLESEQKWPEALAAAKRAESVIASGEVDDETRKAVGATLADLAFVDRLERVRMTSATWVGTSFDYATADREYTTAFREYGIDVDVLPIETSIARLRSRPSMTIPLAAALDNWSNVRRSLRSAVADRRRLASIAGGIDADPLRNRLRAVAGRPFKEAREEVQRLAASIDVRSEHPTTLVVLGDFLMRLDERKYALQILSDAQRTYPADFWLNFHLAFELRRQGDAEGAARFYTAAISLRPTATAALNNLGDALVNRNKFDEATAHFRKAIALYPKFAIAYKGLGGALDGQKKPQEAVDAYRKAVELAPNDAGAYHILGSLLSQSERPDEAVAAYRQALQLEPKNARIYESLAGSLTKLGRMRETVAAYRQALELDPKSTLAYSNLAHHLALCEDPGIRNVKEAVALAQKAAELDPGHTGYARNLAIFRYWADEWKEAIADLERSMKLRQGGDAVEWLYMAMAHWRLGDKTRAREWYDRAAAWMDKRPTNGARLLEVRKEAADLLGVAAQKK